MHILVTLQAEILESLYRALRPGGWMIYSTCTFGQEENTGQLLPWIRSGRLQPAQWSLPEEWGWVHASELDQRWDPQHGAWWSLPGRTQGEGFFAPSCANHLNRNRNTAPLLGDPPICIALPKD